MALLNIEIGIFSRTSWTQGWSSVGHSKTLQIGDATNFEAMFRSALERHFARRGDQYRPRIAAVIPVGTLDCFQRSARHPPIRSGPVRAVFTATRATITSERRIKRYMQL